MKDDFTTRLRKQVWNHRKFSEALELVHSHATFSPPGSMILVVGASGVGKTKLREQLPQRLAGPIESWPMGNIPIADTSIRNDVNGLFSSKTFVLRLLEAVKHPFYGALGGGPTIDGDGPRLDLEKIRLGHSEPQLRLALEKAIFHRGTAYLLVDEAQHLLKTGSVRKAIDNLDSIKGLAEGTGTVVILFGTYEILPLWNRSAQLNRRLQDVVLDRYRKDQPEDLIDFERLLESFSQHIPLSGSLSLRDLNEFIYDSTIGIIGEIARLVRGAHAQMCATGNVSITKQMLLASAHSPAKLQTMRREAFGGEAMLLGEIEVPERLYENESRPPKKGRRGRRLPVRDPVGGYKTKKVPEDGDPS